VQRHACDIMAFHGWAAGGSRTGATRIVVSQRHPCHAERQRGILSMRQQCVLILSILSILSKKLGGRRQRAEKAAGVAALVRDRGTGIRDRGCAAAPLQLRCKALHCADLSPCWRGTVTPALSGCPRSQRRRAGVEPGLRGFGALQLPITHPSSVSSVSSVDDRFPDPRPTPTCLVVLSLGM
jgi:hypothetical protein